MEKKLVRVTFSEGRESPTVILGEVLNDTNGFLTLRTRNRQWSINKSQIISIMEMSQ